ncbi:FmdB family zinc ribbon protein [Brachybacterium sp. AOP43-C2-M15]|uniref:FmdB family zinc ribbon protein n=1 Tax=Brachybacterium sp. AOP43-C2-M15 TaxID=3457661 RepID=UPI0040347244
MPIYEFRCTGSHRYELALPISARDREETCPDCGAPAARLLSAPALGRLGSPTGRLLDSTEATAHSPGVVDRVPGTGARRSARVSHDPRHARLPRP